MKTRKIGSSTFTDSLTPRRFNTTSSSRIARSSGTLRWCQPIGTKLRIASTPEAIEMVIVRT